MFELTIWAQMFSGDYDVRQTFCQLLLIKMWNKCYIFIPRYWNCHKGLIQSQVFEISMGFRS